MTVRSSFCIENETQLEIRNQMSHCCHSVNIDSRQQCARSELWCNFTKLEYDIKERDKDIINIGLVSNER